MNGKIPNYVTNCRSYIGGCRIVVRLFQQNWAEKIHTTELAYFICHKMYIWGSCPLQHVTVSVLLRTKPRAATIRIIMLNGINFELQQVTCLWGYFPLFIHCLLDHIFMPVNKLVWEKSKGKCKAVQLQAWTDPEVSRRLRFPYFKTIGTWRW
jgi:hypothetical protein